MIEWTDEESQILLADMHGRLLVDTQPMTRVYLTATATRNGEICGTSTRPTTVSVAVSMIVLYDAAGVRRQAGEHARVINAIIDDLAHGHPLKEENLKELLGHTPSEVIVGSMLGITVSLLAMPC